MSLFPSLRISGWRPDWRPKERSFPRRWSGERGSASQHISEAAFAAHGAVNGSMLKGRFTENDGVTITKDPGFQLQVFLSSN
jgi:hypothetical protein